MIKLAAKKVIKHKTVEINIIINKLFEIFKIKKTFKVYKTRFDTKNFNFNKVKNIKVLK